jgi:hypothetical protein
VSRFQSSQRGDGLTARVAVTDVVLDDVGDRWRALLIGAPPGSLSF